jgi:hypothetical protein
MRQDAGNGNSDPRDTLRAEVHERKLHALAAFPPAIAGVHQERVADRETPGSLDGGPINVMPLKPSPRSNTSSMSKEKDGMEASVDVVAHRARSTARRAASGCCVDDLWL